MDKQENVSSPIQKIQAKQESQKDEKGIEVKGEPVGEKSSIFEALGEYLISVITPPPPKPQIQFDLNSFITQMIQKDNTVVVEPELEPESEHQPEIAQQKIETLVEQQQTELIAAQQQIKHVAVQDQIVVEVTTKQQQIIDQVTPIEPTKITQNPQTPVKQLQKQPSPLSPADKALSLALRMVRKRKERQVQETKMLEQYRKLQHQEEQFAGEVSRMLQKQNYIKKNKFLREGLYNNTIAPKINNNRRFTQSVILPKLTLAEQRKTTRYQGKLLTKCKASNLHYEAKKIVMDLLYQVIAKSVETYHKKIKYPLNGHQRKISVALGESMIKSRLSKFNFGLSRVIDIAIKSQHVEQSQEEERDKSDKGSGEDKESQVQKQQKSLSSSSEAEEQNVQSEDSSNNIIESPAGLLG